MGKRSYAHQKAQKLGKDRDLGTCQICGSTTHVEGHHLIDHQFGGAADTDNIVTLCSDCHDKVHSGKIQLSKF